MKKLFALVLALLMLGSVACAEGVNLSWDEASAITESVEGEFKTFDEVSMKIWIPSVLKETELSDELKESGYLAYYMTEDETAAVGVQYVNVNGMNLDEYMEAVSKTEGVTGVGKGTVNGIDAISYDYNGNTIMAFVTEQGYALEVSCGPMSDEGFQAVALLIVSSIQAAD